MNESSEGQKPLFYSLKKSFSALSSSINTWWAYNKGNEIICKEYRNSKDLESSSEGVRSMSTECLTETCENSLNSNNVPLHYDKIKECLLELRKSSYFLYPDDTEWQIISSEEFKHIFKNACLTEFNNAFLWAAFTNRSDLLKDLLNLGANLNYYEPTYGLSALHLTAFTGCVEGLNFLLSLDHRNVNVVYKCYTPLHCSVFGNSVETANILLDQGARIDSLSNDSQGSFESVLHSAVKANALNCIRLLYEKGANISQLDNLGRTPIHLAAELGSTECLKVLVTGTGANVNLRTTTEKNTALHLAAERQHYECIDVLLENGGCPNITNKRAQTPLHLAAKEHSNGCVKLLLKKGKANPNAQDTDQRTPLHLAVSKANNLQCGGTIRSLIRYGADVNARDSQDYIPLHLAALNELSECAEVLIMQDADITAKCKSGSTALGIICQKIPTCVNTIRKKLNQSISFTKPSFSSKEFELRLDFSTILKHSLPREIKYLQTLVREEQKELLFHPLCAAFLFLKWEKTRRFYVYRGICILFFVWILSLYVLTGLARGCYNASRNVTDDLLAYDKYLCFNHTLFGKLLNEYPFSIELQWYVLVGMSAGIFLRKISTIPGYSSLTQYFSDLENWLDWCCILTVFSVSFIYNGRTSFWQKHVSAFGVLIGWIYLLYILGQFPVFGTYISMYICVQYQFAKLLFVFSCLLIGFTVSFCILFPESPLFSNVFIGFITVLVMSIGDMNLELITESHPKSASNLEGSKELIFVIFIACVTITLLNLLVGIAVNDIQELQRCARHTKLIKQTKLISYFEKAIFNDCFLRKLWLDIFNWSGMISVKRGEVLIVKPYDQKEKVLPKKIIQEACEIARNQKKRNKPKTKLSFPNYKRQNHKDSLHHTISNSEGATKLKTIKSEIQDLKNEFNYIKSKTDTSLALIEQVLYTINKMNTK